MWDESLSIIFYLIKWWFLQEHHSSYWLVLKPPEIMNDILTSRVSVLSLYIVAEV